MLVKSLKGWIQQYEEKTGDKFDMPKGFKLYYLPERGFASMKVDMESKMCIIYQTCGDGKFWRDMAELMFTNLGINCLSTICTREIKPYIRAFHWTILDEECKNGQYRFLCQDSIGRAIIITHKDVGDNGIPEYWVTQYIRQKARPTIKEFLESEVINNVVNS